MTRPLIGVSTSEVRLAESVQQTPQGEPARREMALGMKYTGAIEAAGGLPVVLPPLGLDAIRPLLARLSAVCLSGGPDLDPTAYAAQPHPELGPTEPELDRFELELAREAWERGLPVLAICRGAQALNVARGGTLHQHVPEKYGGELQHRQALPGDTPAHAIKVTRGSQLELLLGRRALEVNSFHHQSVAKVGQGLKVVAKAPDGVVEAIEARDGSFVVGVQWHAEAMADRPEEQALFSGLVKAAQRSEGGSRRVRAA
jgi:putative glutamine amidotransferase